MNGSPAGREFYRNHFLHVTLGKLGCVTFQDDNHVKKMTVISEA
jgi:hypothetical protein